MSFLGKNINIALVALMLIVVLVAVGTTVIYQKGLSSRTSEYEVTADNLSQCLTTAENYRQKLLDKEQQLEDTSQDIAKYDIIYENKVAEAQSLEDQKRAVERDLQAMTLQKENFKRQLDDEIRVSEGLRADIAELEEDLDTLRDQNARLRADLKQCEET